MKNSLYITIFVLLFSCGCASRQQAIVLYVDAVSLKDQNRPDKAVEKLNQAMKEYAQAFSAYSRATELKPGHFEANFNAARCSYEINDYNNALKYGRKDAQIDSSIIELQQLLGHIYDF